MRARPDADAPPGIDHAVLTSSRSIMIAPMVSTPKPASPETAAPPEEEFVWRSGRPVHGDFRCIDCGYGVSVRRELPRCPMCGSARWVAHRVARRRQHVVA